MASDAQKTNLKHVHFPKIKITKPHFHKPQISKPDFTPVREFLRELSGRLYTLRWRAAMRLRCLPALPQPPRPLAAAICLVGLLVIPMGLALKPTYEITLDDTVIGYVADPSAAQLASNLLETSIASQFGVNYSFNSELKYHTVLRLPTQTTSAEDMVSTLAHAADDLEIMAVLTVNGQTVGTCATADEVQSTLDQILDSYKTSPDDRAHFVENVNVTMSPAPVEAAISADELAQTLTNQHLLDVEVYSTYEYTEPIPYTVRTVENQDLEPNTVQSIQPGQRGQASVQAATISLNGVQTQQTIVSRTVLTQATEAVVAVGPNVVKGDGITTGNFMVPVTNYRFTSAFKYRGDHWHKGVDLAVSMGSPVYAADGGKVILSKWSDSYGNYIIIDHGNGLQTLYAHNSALLANVGDTVSKGQQIALSGSTGHSTGPHVHFEIHQNGVAVDPQLYLSFGTETP